MKATHSSLPVREISASVQLLKAREGSDRAWMGEKGDRAWMGEKGDRAWMGEKGDRSWMHEKGDRSWMREEGDRSWMGEKGERLSMFNTPYLRGDGATALPLPPTTSSPHLSCI